MDTEMMIFLIVVPVVLGLIVAPIISMIMTFKLRSEQKRQADVLAMLLARRETPSAAQAHPAAPAPAPVPVIIPVAKPVPMAKPVLAPPVASKTATPPPLVPPSAPPPLPVQPNELQAKASAVMRKKAAMDRPM